MSLVRARSLIGTLALAGWVSCAAPPTPDDVGSDAPGVDAGRDAHGDARSTDAEPIDGGPIDPDWVSIATGLPAFCHLERANHPERLDQFQIHFATCASRDNCLISDSVPITPQWLATDGTHAMSRFDSPDGWAWLVVAPLDGGAPIAAYRGGRNSDRPLCSLGLGALGGSRLAFEVSFNDSAATAGSAFYLGSVADAASIATPVLDDRADFVASFPQGLYVTESALVVWDSAGLFADVSTGALVPVYDASGPRTTSDDVSVFGRNIMFRAYAMPPYIAIGDAGSAGGAAYYHPTAGNEVHAPSSDGVDVAWIEYPAGATSSPVELWTGAFVSDPALFAPRHVRSLDIVATPGLGAGTWVVPRGTATDPYRIELYDLADGRRRTYATPDDIVTRTTLYISADRILYAAGRRLVQFDPRMIAYDP